MFPVCGLLDPRKSPYTRKINNIDCDSFLNKSAFCLVALKISWDGFGNASMFR